MESFLFKALQLIVALVILVTVHEFGHYIFARMFGIKVNRFYLFFNPWFSLLKYNPRTNELQVIGYTRDENGTEVQKAWKTIRVGKPHPATDNAKPTWRDTVYGLGWLPLGGYCDIAGMVDETKSSKDLAAEPQPWEFRSKAAWKRLLVMVAGVLMNFVLAIIIYAGIAFHWGDRVVPYQAMTEGLDFSPEMQSAGFRDGDRLLTLDGRPFDALDVSQHWKMVQPGARVGVLRDGDTTEIVVPEELVKKLVSTTEGFMSIRVPVHVAKLMPGEGAVRGGIREGDRIVSVASDTTPSIGEFMPALAAHKGETVSMGIIRDGRYSRVEVPVNEYGKIGIQMLGPADIFEIEEVRYSLIGSLPRGWQIGTQQLGSYVSSLKLVFSKEGAQSVGGFGTLGSLFPEKWDWYSFWQITAFLSVILAFMNIIPIPALDGGYTLFLLVEIVTRRKPSERFLEIANMIGMGFLFLLLFYANANDIFRFILK
ncbi:MAG: site-2 protease family protein [Muribaculaceae bacterium]|nr:site-2 protease family protein [Muribaculaceae bacterium]